MDDDLFEGTKGISYGALPRTASAGGAIPDKAGITY
jgi:hypothetical protein